MVAVIKLGMVAPVLAMVLLAAACSEDGKQQLATPEPVQTSNPASGAPVPAATALSSGQPGAARTSTVPSGAGTSQASQSGATFSGAPSTRPTAVPLDVAQTPSGAARYDPWKPVKLGDAVDLSGLVVQVTGARTMEYEAGRDLLLVDLTIANGGREEYPVSSLLQMHAVSGDWRWYSTTIDDLLRVRPQITSSGIRTFDAVLRPGEARKGTAVIPVPKTAQQLGFAFVPSASAASPSSSPALYVTLGIKGSFQPPSVPESAEAAALGNMYPIGRPVSAPGRQIMVMLNGVRERTESLPDYPIDPGEKLVLVDVTMRLLGDAKPLEPHEIAVRDSNGDHLRTFIGEQSSIVRGEESRLYSPSLRRGLLAFIAKRDARGFSLRITPADPRSSGPSVKYLVNETMVFDLGGAPALPTVAPILSSSTPTPRAATPTPRPSVTPRPTITPPAKPPTK